MTDVSVDPDGSPGNPRSRPIVSCLNCRRKKQKCDRRLPCNSCIRSGRPSTCQYAPGQEPILGGSDEDTPSNKRQRLEDEDQPNGTQVSVISFNELQERVSQLEKAFQAQVQKIQLLTNESTIAQEESEIGERANEVQRVGKKTWELFLYKPLHDQVRDGRRVKTAC